MGRFVLRLMLLPFWLLVVVPMAAISFVLTPAQRREDKPEDEAVEQAAQVRTPEEEDEDKYRSHEELWAADLSPENRLAQVEKAFNRDAAWVVPEVPFAVWRAERDQRRRA